MPQRSLSEDWVSANDKLQSTADFFLEDKYSPESQAMHNLFYSPDVSGVPGPAGVDTLFNGKYVYDSHYVAAGERYFNLSSTDVDTLNNNIKAVSSINWANLNYKIRKDAGNAYYFINEYVYRNKFAYLPQGSFFDTLLLIPAAFVPWSIYNFYYYNRFSGISIHLEGYRKRLIQRWKRRSRWF